jgi:hypothetical protein
MAGRKSTEINTEDVNIEDVTMEETQVDPIKIEKIAAVPKASANVREIKKTAKLVAMFDFPSTLIHDKIFNACKKGDILNVDIKYADALLSAVYWDVDPVTKKKQHYFVRVD